MAVASDETHYTVPRDAYRELSRRYSKPTVTATAKPRRRRIALGDAVESMLTRIGITKELVQRITRTKDCGCKARQRWLNQWGYARQAQVERIVEKAARWYGIT